MINDTILVVIAASAIAYGTPLLFAALGELLAERSGVLNLGVEGMMLMGAVGGFWAVQTVGGPGWMVLLIAVMVAALVAAATALIHAVLTISLRASQIVSGLALTIFAGASGLSSYVGHVASLGGQPARHERQDLALARRQLDVRLRPRARAQHGARRLRSERRLAARSGAHARHQLPGLRVLQQIPPLG